MAFLDRRIVSLTCVLLLSAFLSPAGAAVTQAQIDTARNKGLAWLFTHQQADGSWRSAAGTEVAATATAIEALSRAGAKGFPYAVGISWLGNADVTSVDSLTRKILALTPAGLNATPHLQKLVGWRNGILGWGAYDHFDTSFPDTPLALGAIRTAQYTYTDSEYASGLCRIVAAKRGATPRRSAVGPTSSR